MQFRTDNTELEIKVVPNPIYDKSIVTIPFLNSSVIKIFDLDGRLIQEYNDLGKNIFSLDRSEFNSGVYILKLFDQYSCIGVIKFTVL